MGYAFMTGVQKQTFNENLIINPDFAINQRGQASYTLGAATAYTYDRWKLYHNAAFSNCTVQNTSAGLSFTCDINTGENYNIFAQDIENVNAIKGKIVTFTAKISSVSGNFFIGIFDGVNQFRTVFTSDGVVRLTTRLNASATRCLVYLGASGIRTHSCVIEWMKLELGANATPFCPPDRATEIMRCQRYFYIINKNNYDYTEYGMGWTTSLYQAYIIINTPSMRITPSISVSDNSDFQIRSANDTITVTSINTAPMFRCYNDKSIIIAFFTGVPMANDYALASLRSRVQNSYIAFDAEIY